MNYRPIYTEEMWANSPLSVARYTGGVMLDGKEFNVINKHGFTLWQLSDPRSAHYVGDGKAIEPGEPADLIDIELIPYYKKLGREKFLQVVGSMKEGTRNDYETLLMNNLPIN